MKFDPCQHHIAHILIKAGREFRRLKGLPPEPNITTLQAEAVAILQVSLETMNSRIANHLPAPAEIEDDSGKFVIPRMNCPACKTVEGMRLVPICKACKDSEMGLYKTAWRCDHCGYMDRSKKFLTEWLKELNVDWQDGMKNALGIKTLTNEGLK